MNHFATVYFKDPRLRTAAKKEARRLKVSFSQYIAELVADDLTYLPKVRGKSAKSGSGCILPNTR